MDAWILDSSPGTYRFGRIELPPLAADEVRIEVRASALNQMDLWLTKGRPRPHLPHVPGCDAAGVVTEIGAAVTSVAVGDEVVVNPGVTSVEDVIELGIDCPLGPSFQIWGEHCWGGHGRLATIPARNVLPKPPQLSWEAAAAYPITYLTAYRMFRRARLRAGETVLVVGIGSGVSAAALALARQMGAHVVATSRSAAKREQARALGASEVFDSAADSWPVRAHVVIESVGPATWQQSIRALRPGGRLVVCGGTSGQDVTVSLPRLFFKQHEIIGSTLGSYEEFAAVTDLVAAGVPIEVDRVFAYDEYPLALARLERAEHLGKIVLRHD